jgi:hypothetical protein
MRTALVGMALALSAIGAGAPFATSLRANHQLTLLVPLGTPIEGSLDYDRLIFTGPAVGESEVGTCESGGPFPVHSAVVIPGPSSSGGAIRLTEVIVLSDSEVAPGTRLHPLELIGDCMGADGLLVDKWVGTFEP